MLSIGISIGIGIGCPALTFLPSMDERWLPADRSSVATVEHVMNAGAFERSILQALKRPT